MRKIIVSEFVTIDNVIEGPGPVDSFEFAGWTMPFGTPDILKMKHKELFDADALLLGRITYDGFAAAWPMMEGTGDFGERMNSMPKYVVSNTVETLEWNNAKVINGDLPKEISALKEQEGKDILVLGSSDLTKTLIEFDLVDEYVLLLYPVVLGKGKKLFKEGTNIKMKLIDSKVYDTGVTLLRYVPIKE